MTSSPVSAPSSPVLQSYHRPRSLDSPPPAAVQAAASPIFAACSGNERSPTRPVFRRMAPTPPTPMKRSAPGQRPPATRTLPFSSPSSSSFILANPIPSFHLASSPPRSAAAAVNVIAPDEFALERSTKKARKEILRQIDNLDPFFLEFPKLLKNTKFLGNGGESAVFRKNECVIKIPITQSLRIDSHISAQTAVETTEQNYHTLGPIFATLTSIELTPTEFCQTDDGSFYIKQPYFPRAIDSDALTLPMLRELRQLLLSRIRADVRPSNFGVDQQGHLQFFDFNMPKSEKLYIEEMARVWNEVTPELGILLIEEEDRVFEAHVFNFINRPKTINNKNLTATVVQELRQIIFSRHLSSPTPSTVGIDENGQVKFFNRISFEDDILTLDQISHIWDEVGVNLGQLLTEEDDRAFALELAKIFPQPD